MAREVAATPTQHHQQPGENADQAKKEPEENVKG